jgi:hypothetical protein
MVEATPIISPHIATRRGLRIRCNQPNHRACRKVQAQPTLATLICFKDGTMCRDVGSAWIIVDGLEVVALVEIPKFEPSISSQVGRADWQAV